MQDEVVQEVRALVETLVSARLKQVEGDVEWLKRSLKALTLDVKDNLNKPLLHTLKSAQDPVVTGYSKTLKEWTGKTTASVVYDSKVDPFTDDGLFNAVMGKPNVAIVATTTDGDVFGGFYSVAVTKQQKEFFDPNMFIFSFESHGRCATPKKFCVKERLTEIAFVKFFKDDSHGWFVEFNVGRGWFHLGNEKSRTFCFSLSGGFEGMEDTTLTGTNIGQFFTCCRLVAIQLE